jgi:hypothetical protein
MYEEAPYRELNCLFVKIVTRVLSNSLFDMFL